MYNVLELFTEPVTQIMANVNIPGCIAMILVLRYLICIPVRKTSNMNPRGKTYCSIQYNCFNLPVKNDNNKTSTATRVNCRRFSRHISSLSWCFGRFHPLVN